MAKSTSIVAGSLALITLAAAWFLAVGTPVSEPNSAIAEAGSTQSQVGTSRDREAEIAATTGQAGSAGQRLLRQTEVRIRRSLQSLLPRSDFGMTPSAMLQSLLARRCDVLRASLDELAAVRQEVPASLAHGDAMAICRHLVFAELQRRSGSDLSEASFWMALAQVDAEFQATMQGRGEMEAAEFRELYRRFADSRALLLGAELDQALFAVADASVALPGVVTELRGLEQVDAEEKSRRFRAHLSALQERLGIELAQLGEPVEFARMELSLHEGLSLAEQQELMAYYTGADYAGRWAARKQQEQDRQQRMAAYHGEREVLVEQLPTDLSDAERSARLAEIDDYLLDKYQLK